MLLKMVISASQFCPLCRSEDVRHFCRGQYRDYLCCVECGLVFVLAEYFLPPAEEKAIYDQHENSPEDRAYRAFLSRLFDPLQALLKPHSKGLDFGAGPGPTLSCMLAEVGHEVALYDCFYAPNEEVWGKEYDFITATEVVEHLHKPRYELDRLWGCLKPGGYLGIMTRLLVEHDEFTDWHYKNDPTHVCFYAKSTFLWLADYWNADIKFFDDAVILLK